MQEVDVKFQLVDGTTYEGSIPLDRVNDVLNAKGDWIVFNSPTSRDAISTSNIIKIEFKGEGLDATYPEATSQN